MSANEKVKRMFPLRSLKATAHTFYMSQVLLLDCSSVCGIQVWVSRPVSDTTDKPPFHVSSTEA